MSLAPSLQHRTSSRERQHYARIPHQPPNAIRLRTPNPPLSDEAMSNGFNNNALGEGVDTMPEEDPRAARWRDQYLRTEARLAAVLGGAGQLDNLDADLSATNPSTDLAPAAHDALPTVTPKKPSRTIDEDDYGDEDEEEEDIEDGADTNTSPLLAKSASNGTAAGSLDPPSLRMPTLANKLGLERTSSPMSAHAKSSDDVRKKLEQDKKAAEDAAKRSFHTLFHTLESDRDAMLEQQKLDELDRQVETEMSGQAASAPAAGAEVAPQQGTLGTTNLGASSLTLKHLIARIDAQRDKVHASDTQLRSLISEVRKNRSKWANEDRVGQEELYESMEKVLMELKAGEHANPFLQRVNKREAPDYYNIIKSPMDIGTMMKKLKQLQYKSKKEFVDDLMLIWSNCLKYNSASDHPLRKKALHMRKETEKLVPLIPEITVRDRAEVEAEERRMRNGDADADGAEDSEDEEPIMASRGRKAPSKGAKGSSTTNRKAPPAGLEGTPGPDTKPAIPTLNHTVSNLKNEFLRADSEMEGSINGLSTPPPGTLTPLGPNGTLRNGAHGSQTDISDADGTGASMSGFFEEDADLDDLEYKTWKQVTKKDRATIAAERHRLFRDDQLQVDEPAILRSKAGMRRWLRHRKQALEEESAANTASQSDGKDGVLATAGETLAEGIEEEEERQIPDYYDPVCAIPDLNERQQWIEDSEGHVIQQYEEYMRIVPKGQFVAPEGSLAKKMESNMRQMQETRKICAKIGIVKQMQLQSQVSEPFALEGHIFTCYRCIRISFKSTILNLSWKQTSSLWLFPKMVQSWPHMSAVQHSSEVWARFFITLGLRNSNHPLSTPLQTLQVTFSRNLSKAWLSIVRHQKCGRRLLLLRQTPPPRRVGPQDSRKKKPFYMHCKLMVSISSHSKRMLRMISRGWAPNLLACMTGCDRTMLNCSDLRWTMQALMVPVLSMTVASNLLVATLLKTSAKTSLVSKSLGWTRSLESASVFLFICCKTGCINCMLPKTQSMFPPLHTDFTKLIHCQ